MQRIAAVPQSGASAPGGAAGFRQEAQAGSYLRIADDLRCCLIHPSAGHFTVQRVRECGSVEAVAEPKRMAMHISIHIRDNIGTMCSGAMC